GGVLDGEVFDAHPRDRAGAVGGEQVGGHDGLRCAGVGVVEHEGVDGPGQAPGAVGGVGAVPLDPGVVEATAQVGGHGHEAAVWAVGRHAVEGGVGGESDHGAVGVGVLTGHPVIPLR